MVTETGIAPEDMRSELLRSFAHVARHFEEMSDELARLWHIAADCANQDAELGQSGIGQEMWEAMVACEGMEGEVSPLDTLLAQLNTLSQIVGKPAE